MFNIKLAAAGLVKEKTNPVDILKTIAVSRIVLRNFGSIRAYWVALGETLAQVALNYGADDFGGTIPEENVVTAAGKAHKPARAVEIIKAVESVGRPVAQRNTGYEVL